MRIDDADVRLRNTTYALFVELGRAPRAEEVADAEKSTLAEVTAGWHRLHAAHALALHARGAIRMANPFSAVPTAYRVWARGRLHLKHHEPLPVGRAHRTVARWPPPGETISVSKLSGLAHAWWHDRLSPDWQPHSREQNQAILDRLGLSSSGASVDV